MDVYVMSGFDTDVIKDSINASFLFFSRFLLRYLSLRRQHPYRFYIFFSHLIVYYRIISRIFLGKSATITIHPAISTRYQRRLHGYSLVELLVGIFIFSVGILGVVVMQLSAKRASLDAFQRSFATDMANDIIERMRSNPQSVGVYVANIATTKTKPLTDCRVEECNPAQLARYDVWDWWQILTGANRQSVDGHAIGILVNPQVCMAYHDNVLRLTIVWKGLLPAAQSKTDIGCANDTHLYGENNAERQYVSFATVLLQ